MSNKLTTSLTGGMNNKASPLVIKDSECELILNYNVDTNLGALTKRNGYTVFGSQMVSGKSVQGMYQYINSGTPAESTTVAVVNNVANTQGVIYYGNWATSKTDDTSRTSILNYTKTRFATFLDKLFRVNGMDVVAGSTNVNGSAWTVATTPDTDLPETITPSFISVFQDRVYVARSGAANSSTVYFSSLPTAGAITWTIASDYFEVNPDDGDQIQALENNGNRLLIFKERALYRWTWGQTEPDRLIGVGTSSQECVKTNYDIGITFFANQFGAYAYSGDRPKLISRKIQKWFDAVPSTGLVNFVAETDSDHYYLYLADSLSVDGRIYTNVMAVYTISLDAWVIYTLGTPVKFMTKFINAGTTDGEWIYFGNDDGYTFRFNYGTIDNATAIAGEIITKEHLLSFPEKTTLNYVDVLTLQPSRVMVTAQLDRNRSGIARGDFLSLGGCTDRVNTFRVGKECRTCRLRITDHSSTISIIEGFNLEHQPKPERKP